MVAAAITALTAVLAYLIIAPITRRDDCSSEILVNGRGYDVGAATKALELKAKVSPVALGVISEKFRYYAERSADLCRDLKRGALSPKDYVARKDQAAQFYMTIDRAAAAGVLAAIGTEDRDEFDQLLTQSTESANSPAEQLGQVTLVNSDGAILPSGATVRNGDWLALNVHVPRSRYLYVLAVGSSGSLNRLYPASTSSTENPVQGDVRIPPSLFYPVVGPPGRELLYVFMSDKPDPKIERVAEISTHQELKKRAAAQLRDAVVLRDLLAPQPIRTTARPAASRPVDVTGRFGRASITFELNHAG